MDPLATPAFALSLAFAAALLASMLVKFWLATRQMRHVAAHRDRVPAPFAGRISLEAHQRAADYTLAKGRLGLLAWPSAPRCCSAGRCSADSTR